MLKLIEATRHATIHANNVSGIKKLMKPICGFVLVFALAGCMKHSPAMQADRIVCTGDERTAQVTLGFQEKKVISFCDDVSMNLFFSNVISDSRCPMSLDCFSAGSAVIEIGVNGQNYQLDVYHLVKPASVTVQINGKPYLITAVELSPLFDHFIDITTVDKSQYRLTIRIEKA
ncbi:MAG TPA: hypothetical protein VGC95_02030 [Chitinophagaceae bacterium]